MLAELDRLEQARTSVMGLGWALLHCAQSIDCSRTGYPKLKPALFRATIGRLALKKFLGQGFMSHDRKAPIDGAKPLPADANFAEGLRRLRGAIADFQAHQGPLQPHLAYGPVDKADYERVHAFHLADHLSGLIVE